MPLNVFYLDIEWLQIEAGGTLRSLSPERIRRRDGHPFVNTRLGDTPPAPHRRSKEQYQIQMLQPNLSIHLRMDATMRCDATEQAQH